ncbi:hypothetical protein NDU88_003688 [Pleurodeles waltl]|uniref:Uncharacterized protein n=1 Tax=Pleurodeles waltl TaxID=8319 RepID=A0AAV7W654_PLEWA|nr:hypothetical protein NDU88_003688 [Pleurodeles waltl]
MVTADYPQRAGQDGSRPFLLPGSIHIVLTAHALQTPRATSISGYIQQSDERLRRATDTLEDATWLTPHFKRRKRKSSKAGPSLTQAVTEQEKAIQAAEHFSHNSFMALSDKFQFPSGTDTGATSPSGTSGDERAQLVTPRLTDDL